jgi:hypothetical protein
MTGRDKRQDTAKREGGDKDDTHTTERQHKNNEKTSKGPHKAITKTRQRQRGKSDTTYVHTLERQLSFYHLVEARGGHFMS